MRLNIGSKQRVICLPSLAGALAGVMLTGACSTGPAGPITPDTQPVPIVKAYGPGDPVGNVVFPLLAQFEATPAARGALASDERLAILGAEWRALLEEVYKDCEPATRCPIETLILPDHEIEEIGDRLSSLAVSDGPLSILVHETLRPSGQFKRFSDLNDADFLRAAWIQTAEGVNRLYRVYGMGEAPRYPEIDAISHDANNAEYRSLIRAVLETQIDARTGSDAFFADWLRVGLDLLVINQRDEAARYRPLLAGVNRAAANRSETLDWSHWPYAAILVPGAGTLEDERGLSAAGALRVRLAVRRFESGLAPFLIVSGGHVHPDKTPYSEAIEMKAELMARYDIPENAILVDPHARHTTTNLRNGVRLLNALKTPDDALVLIVTSRDQSAYIESALFAQRNEMELGYQPMEVVERLGPNDLVAQQNLTSLHIDPQDPLDP